jgi:siroheme synthase (precorrin-2 oxidase/ferrochelatase)
MVPIILTPQGARIVIAGQGAAFNRRMRLFSDSGIAPSMVFEGRQPELSQLADLDALFVAGFHESVSCEIYANAKAAGLRVNVEDVPKLCDVHVTD